MKNSIHLSAALHINIMLGQRWGEHGSRLGVGGGGVNKSIFTVFKIWCFTSILLCLFYVFVRRCSTDPVYPMWSLKLYQSCLRLVEAGRRLTGPDLSSWDITSPHGPLFCYQAHFKCQTVFYARFTQSAYQACSSSAASCKNTPTSGRCLVS